jgi:F0F1-type ATP synthase gamma subunit
MRDFLKATGSKDTCLVIGDTGKQIWTNEMVKRKNVTFLSFDEDAPSSSEVSKFLQRAQDYARVFVFYPSFVSVFQQTVAQADISFRPSNEGESGNADTAGNREDFLLEPELQEMITFFDTQVRFVLFEQILLETQLAQVAARLVKMDTADQNADRLIINEQRELRRVVSSYSSKRMLETVIGYLQWNTQKI